MWRWGGGRKGGVGIPEAFASACHQAPFGTSSNAHHYIRHFSSGRVPKCTEGYLHQDNVASDGARRAFRVKRKVDVISLGENPIREDIACAILSARSDSFYW